MRIAARRSDEGFSYMETILALFIAAVSVTALSLVIIGLFRAPVRIRAAAQKAYSISLLDRSLRRAASRIRSPWWTDGPDVSLYPEFLSVNWLDGVAEKTLNIEIGTGEIIIDCGGEAVRVTISESWTPRFLPLAPETGGGDSTGGFRLLLDTQGKGAEIWALFGSQSLMEASR